MPKPEDVLKQIGIGFAQELKRVGVAAVLAGAEAAAQRGQGLAREVDKRLNNVRQRAQEKIREVIQDIPYAQDDGPERDEEE